MMDPGDRPPVASWPVSVLQPAPPRPPGTEPPAEKWRDTEPVALAGAVQGVLSALFAVLVGFGWVDLSAEHIGLLMALYTAVVVAVQAAARAKVWSPASVRRLQRRS